MKKLIWKIPPNSQERKRNNLVGKRKTPRPAKKLKKETSVAFFCELLKTLSYMSFKIRNFKMIKYKKENNPRFSNSKFKIQSKELSTMKITKRYLKHLWFITQKKF